MQVYVCEMISYRNKSVAPKEEYVNQEHGQHEPYQEDVESKQVLWANLIGVPVVVKTKGSNISWSKGQGLSLK